MPKLAQTLKTSLLAGFDWPSRVKGDDYFRRGHVLSYASNRADERLYLTAQVEGARGRTYTTSVCIQENRQRFVNGSCSCPVSLNCKHMVALISTYLREGKDSYKAATYKPATFGAASEPAAKISSIAIVTSDPSKFSNRVAPERTALPKKPSTFGAPQELLATLRAAAELRTSSSRVAQNSSTQIQARPKSQLIYLFGKEHYSNRPRITPCLVNLLKTGEFGAHRTIRPDELVNRNTQSVLPEDREIAKLWKTITATEYSWDQKWDCFPDAEIFRILAARILATGRCYLDLPSGAVLSLGPERAGQIAWEEHRGQWRMAVVSEDDEYQHKCFRWSYPWYFDEERGICGPVKLDVPTRVLEKLLGMRAITQNEASAIPPLLAQLGLSDLVPPPPGQKSVLIELKKPTPTLSVAITKAKQPLQFSDWIAAAQGQSVKTVIVTSDADSDSAETIRIGKDGTTILERPIADPQDWLQQQMMARGFRPAPPNFVPALPKNSQAFVAPAKVWADLDTKAITELRADGWQISEYSQSQIAPRDLSEATVQIEAEDQDSEWWFSLGLNIVVDGKRISLLPILVSAIRELPNSLNMNAVISALNKDGKFFASLPDGSMISLPFDRIESILAALHEVITRHGDTSDKLEISALHAAQLANGYLSNAEWTGDTRIKQLVDRLRKLTEIEAAAAPKDFSAELRAYQAYGVGWLQFLAEQKFGGILADDMGLGKTVQMLAHICLQKQENRLTQPFLVVCPTSVLPNWLAECKKFAKHLNVVAHVGSNRAQLKTQCRKADVVLTTYPILTKDADAFKSQKWHGIALDEAQAIKNPATHVASVARSLKANYRFCMTGTPIENHLGELWSQFQFLLPGLLGDNPTFNAQIRKPIEVGNDLGLKAALSARIRPFILRRTKQQVAPELPEKQIIVQPIELAGSQLDLYETVRLASTKQIRDEIARKGFKQSQIMILDALLKLRQVCCDPRLVKLSAAAKARESAKLDYLIEMIQQLTEEGRKLLVFSQFTSMLNLIGEALETNRISFVELRGDTRDRKTPVEQFQNGDVPVFLISLKAGGTGLNLTAADVVIHYDPWWNPAVEDQATDRTHRIGQTKKVFVYKLIAQGTIEQRMVELQNRKRSLANSIYDENGALTQSFTEADLLSLLQPIG